MALASCDIPLKSNELASDYSKSPHSMLKVVNSHNHCESQLNSKKLKLAPTQLTKVKSMSALYEQSSESSCNDHSMLSKRKLHSPVDKEACRDDVKPKKVFKEQR